MARRHAIEEWVDPALLELCERPESLSLDEARQMDFEDVVLLGSVRQNVRSPTLTTNGAGIRDCIQAWRNGEPWGPTPTPGRSGPHPGPRALASDATHRGASYRLTRPSGLTPGPLDAPLDAPMGTLLAAAQAALAPVDAPLDADPCDEWGREEEWAIPKKSKKKRYGAS